VTFNKILEIGTFKMREIKIEAYSFEELSKEIQEKLIEEHRHVDVEETWWSEDVIEEFKEEVSEKGFQATQVYFSGFWSQGDGAMFEYDGIEDSLFLEFIDSLSISKNKREWLHKWANCYAKGSHFGYYSHKKSCNHNIDIEFNESYDVAPNISEWIYSFQEDLEKFIESRYEDIALELYATLEKEYDYRTSDENVKEAVKSFDWIYNKQGTNITYL
jgi:hypothetical protein